MPFDLSMTKLLILGAIAMLVFGPDKLPQVARDAGRMLRQMRAFAQQARTELKSELGDAVGDFDIADLNPRAFVRKHLLDDLDDAPPATMSSPTTSMSSAPLPAETQRMATLTAGEVAPFDPDAT